MNHTISISVVSPVYRAAECLEELYTRLLTTLEQLTNDFEILLVNDCSPDNSWEILKILAEKDTRVKIVNLSKNFGQHYAISAGLSKCSKEWIVVMDCDLQDQPEEIGSLLGKSREGFDIVLGQRIDREDTIFKKLFSRSFYFLLGYLTGAEQDSTVANFGIYHKKVIQAVLSSNENIRYFPSMIRWVGFKKAHIGVKHSRRLHGRSSYNFNKMLRLAVDIILAYSDKPLIITVKLGIFFSSVAFIFGFYIFFQAMQGKIQVLGYASLIVSIWFFGGLILFVLGIMGLYIGKTFEQVKGRPSYIISETKNL